MEQITEALHRGGSKATPGRIALLSVLEKSKEPMSISEIVSALHGKVNQTTVYRALETLSDSGVVQRIDLGHSHTHYELAEGKQHHHHISCIRCNKIQDLPICAYDTFAAKALKQAPEFATIENHSFEIFGLCKNCIKK